MKAQAMTPGWGSEILHVPRIAFVSLLVAEFLLCRRSSSAQGVAGLGNRRAFAFERFAGDPTEDMPGNRRPQVKGESAVH